MTDSAIAALVAELEADHHDADLNYWNRLAGRAAAVLRQVLEQRNRTEKVYAQALHDYNALRDEAAAREVALREALEVIATGSPSRVRSWLVSHGYADADSFVEPEYLEAVDVACNILANPSPAAQKLVERLAAADHLALHVEGNMGRLASIPGGTHLIGALRVYRRAGQETL